MNRIVVKHIICTLSLSLLVTVKSNAQFHLISGTNLSIGEDTEIIIDIPSQNFVIDSGAFVINDGKIILGTTTDMEEFMGYPIQGKGTEITERNLNMTLSGINIGGLGLLFNNDSISGLTTLTRGHTALTNFGLLESVKRWFQISTTGIFPAGFSLTLYYDPTELNGNDASTLRIISASDTSLAWTSLGGTSNETLFNTTSSIGADNFYSLLSADVEIISLNDTVLCVGDSLFTDYSGIGLFNPANQFILQISDENGSFSSPAFNDTLTSDLIDFHLELSPPLAESPGYKVRVSSTDPVLHSDEIGISIHGFPIITFSGLSDQYCSNESVAAIGTDPIGGIYDVSFLAGDSIYPSDAPIGMNQFSYTVANSAGCISVYYDSIEIIPVPVIPTIVLSNDTLFSSAPNGNQWYLDGSPLAGSNDVYLIPGSNGIYEVEVTNSGCTNISDTFTFSTLEIEKQHGTESIVIYPNPATYDFVTIYVQNNRNINRMHIFDSAGKLIQSANNHSREGKILLDISSLSSGIYSLHFFLDEEVISKKLVVVK